MKEERFNEYLSIMEEHGALLPTLGYRITFAQFCQIAEVMACHIYDIGWERYKNYIDAWTLKVDDREKLKGRL